VHFSLKIWQLVATILMILLTVNWPNFVQFSIQLDVVSSAGAVVIAMLVGLPELLQQAIWRKRRHF